MAADSLGRIADRGPDTCRRHVFIPRWLGALADGRVHRPHHGTALFRDGRAIVAPVPLRTRYPVESAAAPGRAGDGRPAPVDGLRRAAESDLQDDAADGARAAGVDRARI